MGETVRQDAIMHYSSILPDVIRLADEASEKVLHIYESDFKVRYKEDNSPITAAEAVEDQIRYSAIAGLALSSEDFQKRMKKRYGDAAGAGAAPVGFRRERVSWI